jgi:hypothetical protein
MANKIPEGSLWERLLAGAGAELLKLKPFQWNRMALLLLRTPRLQIRLPLDCYLISSSSGAFES